MSLSYAKLSNVFDMMLLFHLHMCRLDTRVLSRCRWLNMNMLRTLTFLLK